MSLPRRSETALTSEHLRRAPLLLPLREIAGSLFPMKASTASRMTSSQIAAACDDLGPAIAAADEIRIAFCSMGKAHRHQSVKSLAREIDTNAGQFPISSLVSIRLLWGGPLAVSRRVILIVIYPIKKPPRRRLPHVFPKRFKAVTPSIADRDPPSAVIFELAAIGIETPAFHRRPASVKRTGHSAGCVAVGAILPAGTNAATGGRGSPLKIVSQDKDIFSAVTPAPPNGVAAFGVRIIHDDKSPKTPAGKIDASHGDHYA
jgi:hypothetical protein